MYVAAGHNMLRAHAKAWHVYDKEFRNNQGGRISIVVVSQYFDPKTQSDADIQAAERGLQWYIGWMAHPIFIGDYPPVMKERIEKNSKAKGLASRYIHITLYFQII